MVPELINPDDWILSGGGAQGDSYFHRSDEGVMLKLFAPHLSQSLVEEEFSIIRRVSDAGFPCIMPKSVVTDGHRYGLVIPRIKNKKSFCTAVGEDPSCLDDMARRFAGWGRSLHTTEADTSVFGSAISLYRGLLTDSKSDDKEYLAACDRILTDMEQHDRPCTCLHGDFHFGNVITDGERDFLIDLGAFTYGNPLFDLSMFYFSTHFMPQGATEKVYHITDAQALAFWNAFKKYYYGCDVPDAVLERQYAPYLLLRTLSFERDMGRDAFQIGYCRQFLTMSTVSMDSGCH